MGTCHQETLQVLLLAGPDHQQAHYPTCILCYKQRSSHSSELHGDPEHVPGPVLASPGPVAPADALSSPVQFSKEKYILDSSPEKLHKELEEELKLSSTDLRSHAWYHGRIPREVRRGMRVARAT